jgi:hypothetical protein
MTLHQPSFEELLQLDLNNLVDLLVVQTTEYSCLLKDEGLSFNTRNQKELVNRIQSAIDLKLSNEKKSFG